MAGFQVRISLYKIFIIAAVVVFIMFLTLLQNNSLDWQTLQNSKNPTGNQCPLIKQKKILIWTKYWGSEVLWNNVFKEILSGECPTVSSNNCVFTTNKSELDSSETILFHLIDLHPEYSFPPLETRNPKQIWIAMIYEPPYVLSKSPVHFSKFANIFNRTMSYRRDSDIVVSYGSFHKIKNGSMTPKKYVTLSRNGDWMNNYGNTTNYVKSKRRLAAWFSSECYSQSGRESYIAELQKFIEIDIYGDCGKLQCGEKKSVRTPYKIEYDDCYFLVSTDYKFVLAFENSICDDYVTEKLYDNLKLNVIPIVYGGADYSKFTPPNSVIDASQFSPKELAKYLLALDANETLYNEYFKWKTRYYIETNDGVPMACDLCEKLNDPVWVSQKKVYKHLGSWITDKCSPGYSNSSIDSYESEIRNFAKLFNVLIP